MFKRDIIKKLHEKGIRKMYKPGAGSVSLNHIKTANLAAELYKLEHSDENSN